MPPQTANINFEHFKMPMIHPTTGETITSYTKLMNNPATQETGWQHLARTLDTCAKAMTKLDKKWRMQCLSWTQPTYPIFPPTNQMVTYANVVISHCPQKEDPNWIWITAGGNLINYPEELTTRTADITKSKLHWNSIFIMRKAKYMCLDIKNFYLLVQLDRYKYMRIWIGLFPPWIIKQYNLTNKEVYHWHIYLEMHKAVWGLPQAGILVNKLLQKRLAPMGAMNANKHLGYGNISHILSCSP